MHRLIDWNRIRSRYDRYPAIRQAFPLEMMKKGCETPPYYCHYMAWCLGAWPQESEFLVRRLEELFRVAEMLPNWEYEKSLLTDTDFSVFWSLVWQLQVAEYLHEIGEEACWAKSGPDLSVKIRGERWFVECYTYRKSFGILSFLEELLLRLDPTIRIKYNRCLPFSLPSGRARERFLHEVLVRFLDPVYLAKHKEDAEQEYPVILYRDPDSSMQVYVKGSDADAYIPGRIPNVVGHSESYLATALREAVRAKQSSNDLATHHPNLVAANYLLSTDYQLAESSRRTPSLAEIDSNIDALTVSAVGIDEKLTREKLEVAVLAGSVELGSLARIARARPTP
ncbi:MAG: hypothetical protein OXC19_00090 [Bryobacterales bacterium]|nr:hypothetical protein [Bryobacterales bacterium]